MQETTSKERQQAFRDRMRDEGYKVIQLWLKPEVIDRFEQIASKQPGRSKTERRTAAATRIIQAYQS